MPLSANLGKKLREQLTVASGMVRVGTAKADRDTWPQVSVVRSEDQTLARKVLRDAGLEPATRFADELAAARGVGSQAQHGRASLRVKLVLLALIAGVSVLIALTILRH